MRRWVGVVALVLAAMAVGRVLVDHVDLGRPAVAPFVRTGGLGDEVELDYAAVRVDGVRAGRFLWGIDTVESRGVFVVVDTRLRATRHYVQLTGIELIDGQGRRYTPEDRGTTCSRTVQLSTGATEHAMFCFDVPADPDTLSGARIELAREEYGAHGPIGDQRREHVAQVDLGISRAQARELAGSRLLYRAYQAGWDEYPKDPVPYDGERP